MVIRKICLLVRECYLNTLSEYRESILENKIKNIYNRSIGEAERRLDKLFTKSEIRENIEQFTCILSA
jgi:hypothetical protein